MWDEGRLRIACQTLEKLLEASTHSQIITLPPAVRRRCSPFKRPRQTAAFVSRLARGSPLMRAPMSLPAEHDAISRPITLLVSASLPLQVFTRLPLASLCFGHDAT